MIFFILFFICPSSYCVISYFKLIPAPNQLKVNFCCVIFCVRDCGSTLTGKWRKWGMSAVESPFTLMGRHRFYAVRMY